MVPHPIGLSSAQMDLIRKAAKALPHNWRSRFLEAVTDWLLPFDVLTDALVAEAVDRVIDQMFGGRAA